MAIKRLNNWAATLRNKDWFEYFLLIVVIGLAAVLRFYKLGAWSFWIDEIYTVNHALRHFSSLELILDNIPPARNWVPVSVILTAQVFNLAGESEWSARLVSAIIGIATILILYFPMKKIFGVSVTLMALFLLALAPWHVNWSQNARGYTSLLLFYTLALFAFYFGIEKDRPIHFLYFFVFLYLAASERLIALFIVPVLFLYLLLIKVFRFQPPPGLRVRNILILLSPGILLIIVHILSMLITGESVFLDIADEIVSTFYGRSIENPFTQAFFIVFEIGIPLLALALFSGMYWLFQKSRVGLLIFLGAVAPFVLVVLLTPFMFTEERYVLVTLPCWLILAAYGLTELLSRLKSREKIILYGILVVLIAESIGSNVLYFHTNNGNRRDWRGAFSIVDLNSKDGDMIVSTWPELGSYYLGDEVVLWQDTDPDTIIESGKRTWFLVIPDMAWYTDSEDLYWWVSHNTRLIDILYLRTVDNTILEIYLYDPDDPENNNYIRYDPADPAVEGQ